MCLCLGGGEAKFLFDTWTLLNIESIGKLVCLDLKTSYTTNCTCFADPIHVTIHFFLQFLFLLEQQESCPALHSIFLFCKFPGNYCTLACHNLHF